MAAATDGEGGGLQDPGVGDGFGGQDDGVAGEIFLFFSSVFAFRSFSGAADLVLWVDLVEGLDLEDGVVR